jgi:hypothetical protein
LTPFRILDTRTANPIGQASWLNLQVTGVGTTPVPATASAVVLNVTVVNPTHSGFLSVAAASTTTAPTFSDLNFVMGETVANLVTAPLSATGGVSIYNSYGSSNVVVDVEGYYTSTIGTTGLYNSVTPYRALGSLAEGATVQANTAVPVTVTGGTTGVPTTATAVEVNVTAAAGTNPSFLTVYPAGATLPVASNLNFAADEVVANRVIVGVGTNGVIEVYNHTGTVSVDVDIDGYYAGTGSYFVPITPVRVVDTRTASVVGTGTPIASAASESFQIATTASGLPATAYAVAGNFTVVAGASSGYLTVYPTSATTNPVASDVNWVAKEVVPNFTIAPTNDVGSVEVYNSKGAAVNLVVDAFGYFMQSTPTIVSTAVTFGSIAITYNEAVNCPTVGNGAAVFTYDWTGSASGGPFGACSGGVNSATPDVLTFADPAPGFILPSSTGGSITYTSSATLADDVFAAGPVYELGQTTSVPAATLLPVMKSAYVTSTTIVVTYNEDVTCSTAAGGAISDFAYDYTGLASGGLIASCVFNGVGSDSLTLTASSTFTAPASDATLIYTAPSATTIAPTNALYAAGSEAPVLYAASQTLAFASFATPAITAAVVTPGASGTGTILVTYSEPVTCPSGAAAAQTIFEYTNSGSPAYPSTCAAVGGHNNELTLGTFYNATTGTGAVTLVLPGAADNLIYTVPASESGVNAVNSTVDFPAFPLAQTFALTATPVPAMVSAVVGSTTIAITYNENVSCATTVVPGDFAYYSTGTTSGLGTGTITSGCATDVLTLTTTGAFTAPVGTTASIVYTAPATNSVTTSVYATNTALYAATQTLALTQVPAMVSAVVTATSIAITYNEPVFCPTTFVTGVFVYDYETATAGGTATACAASGDVLTLTPTSPNIFTAPTSSASIVYTSSGTLSSDVFAGSAPVAYAATQTLPWSSIS